MSGDAGRTWHSQVSPDPGGGNGCAVARLSDGVLIENNFHWLFVPSERRAELEGLGRIVDDAAAGVCCAVSGMGCEVLVGARFGVRALGSAWACRLDLRGMSSGVGGAAGAASSGAFFFFLRRFCPGAGPPEDLRGDDSSLPSFRRDSTSWPVSMSRAVRLRMPSESMWNVTSIFTLPFGASRRPENTNVPSSSFSATNFDSPW